MVKHEHSGNPRKHFENPGQILLDAGLQKGNSFLDIGTGSGYMAVAAAEIVGDTAKVYAVDSHQESISALNNEVHVKGIKNISAVKADAAKELSVPNGTIQVCLMSNVIHGFAVNGELDAVMKNVNRALIEEGRIIVIDFKKNNADFGPPPDIKLSPEKMDEKLAPYGYKLEKSFEAGPNHYCLVFQRVSLQDKYC
jgi:ubiquinone/menaquinone biosynthesis C-methylase UbiE